MDLLWQDVGKTIEGECAFMGNNRSRPSAEEGHVEILKGRGWVEREPIDALRNSRELTSTHVVGKTLA